MQMSTEQVAAQRAIENFLGQHSSQAASTVLDLNGAEVDQVLEGAKDRFTARAELKRILAAAYDRRQRIGEVASQAEMARRQLEVAARIVLEREHRYTPAESVAAVAAVPDEGLQQLAALTDVGGVQAAVEQIRARYSIPVSAAVAAAVQPIESPVETGTEPPAADAGPKPLGDDKAETAEVASP